MKISGLKLNFSEDGDVEIEKGKRQLPHRVDLIEAAFKEKRYDDVENMLFNFGLRDCRHATDSATLTRELALCDKLMEIKEKEQNIA